MSSASANHWGAPSGPRLQASRADAGRRRRWLRWLLVGVLGTGTAVHGAWALELASDTELATAGFYRLSWHAGEGQTEFELQEANNARFDPGRTLYRGPDLATVLSGRADGQYFYRVRTIRAAQTGPWSEVVRVNVEHHPLARALAFFAAGAVVFVATLGLIAFGTRASRGGRH